MKSGFSVWLALPNFLNNRTCPLSFHVTGGALGSFHGWAGPSPPLSPRSVLWALLTKLVNSQSVSPTAPLSTSWDAASGKRQGRRGKKVPGRMETGAWVVWLAQTIVQGGEQSASDLHARGLTLIRSPHLPVTVT